MFTQKLLKIVILEFFEEKVKIKTSGSLNLTEEDMVASHIVTKNFYTKIYKTNKEISGCDKENATFCLIAYFIFMIIVRFQIISTLTICRRVICVNL